MPSVYRYQPIVDAGPAGTVTRFANTENDSIRRIASIDGWEYVSVPDNVTIPVQPDGITLEKVNVTPSLRLELIRANRSIALSKQVAREQVQEIVGDAEDQVADLEKRISLMERLVYQLAWRILDGQSTDDLKQLYGDFLQLYVSGTGDGSIEARSDLHKPQDLVDRLTARSTAVTQVMADHAQRVDALLP